MRQTFRDEKEKEKTIVEDIQLVGRKSSKVPGDQFAEDEYLSNGAQFFVHKVLFLGKSLISIKAKALMRYAGMMINRMKFELN